MASEYMVSDTNLIPFQLELPPGFEPGSFTEYFSEYVCQLQHGSNVLAKDYRLLSSFSLLNLFQGFDKLSEPC